MQICQLPALEAQQVALPTVIVAGLIDGLNPCAIGMMVFLLGYLVVFAGKPERVLKTGLLYIATVYLTYFVIGLFFYEGLSRFLGAPGFSEAAAAIKVILGVAVIGAGLINLKDFFFPGRGLSLEIPQNLRPKLQTWVEKSTYPATFILAILVTLFETPCSFPLYAGTVGILSRCDFSTLQLLVYLGVYNLLFVLPLILILGLIFGGVEIVYLKEWEHRNKSRLRGLMGALLVVLGVIVLVIK